MRLIIVILTLVLASSTPAQAQIPLCQGSSCLDLLKREMEDMNRRGLERDGVDQVIGGELGIRNRPTNPRMQESPNFLSLYMSHNEENFSSSTNLNPLEYLATVPKNELELKYLTSMAPQQRLETGLNSVFGAWYQMLMFQEPTLAQGSMNIKAMWDSTLASYQADRGNELIHRINNKRVAPEIFDQIDKCVSDQISGFGGSFNSDFETVKQYCQSQYSMAEFLSARNSMGWNQCEWGSLVMFQHLSLEVPSRMRAMFGDDELCPMIGNPTTYVLQVSPPSFSIREVWWTEYQLAVAQIELVLTRARLENGGYELSAAELAAINPRPSVKVSQALITAIKDGLAPNKERKELIHWLASEKANGFVDFACSEAEMNLREAAASPATPTEHARWRKKVDAVCGVRKEMTKEMEAATKNQEVFEKILEKGDRTTSDFANATVARASRARPTTRGAFGSSVPADSAMNELF